MRSHITVCVSVMSLTAASLAHAHHDTPAPTRSEPVQLERQSQLQMDLSTTAFELEDHKGQFWTVAAAARLQLSTRVGLRLRLPVHTLGMDESDRRTGVGDAVVGADVGVLDRTATMAKVGLDIYLPLGTRDEGLGHGTAALSPYAEIGQGLAPNWIAFARAGGAFNTHKRNTSTPTFIEHRSDVEVRGSAGLTLSRERTRVSAAAQTVVPMAPAENRGTAFFTATPSAAVLVAKRTWLALFAEVPLHQSRQLDWHSGVAVSYVWGKHETPQPLGATLSKSRQSVAPTGQTETANDEDPYHDSNNL